MRTAATASQLHSNKTIVQPASRLKKLGWKGEFLLGKLEEASKESSRKGAQGLFGRRLPFIVKFPASTRESANTRFRSSSLQKLPNLKLRRGPSGSTSVWKLAPATSQLQASLLSLSLSLRSSPKPWRRKSHLAKGRSWMQSQGLQNGCTIRTEIVTGRISCCGQLIKIM